MPSASKGQTSWTGNYHSPTATSLAPAINHSKVEPDTLTPLFDALTPPAPIRVQLPDTLPDKSGLVKGT